MKHVILLAMSALPLIACGGAVDGEGSVEGNTGTSQSELSGPINVVPTFATTVLINFDVDPSGAALADGAILDTMFTSSKGVTFTGIVCTPGAGCANGHAYARSSVTPNSPQNVVADSSSGVPLLNAEYGAVRADFATSRTWVSIDAQAVPFVEDAADPPTALPWFEAYDANNALVGRVYYPIAYGGTNYGTYQTLRIDAGSARIKWVRFSSQAPGNTPLVFGQFDNLRFNGLSRTICVYSISC